MSRRLLALCTGLVLCAPALGHLMPAGRATLNFVGDNVYAVIALPTAAFADVDDDGDGRVSAAEFHHHLDDITATVRKSITLADTRTALGLLDVVLVPDVEHHGEPGSIDQVTVMGRFALPDPRPDRLTLTLDLFDRERRDTQLEITARRRADGWKAVVRLSPETPAAVLELATAPDHRDSHRDRDLQR